MGVAVSALILEITLNKGRATKSLGSVAIPSTLGRQISSTGGENIQLNWTEVSDQGTEVLGTAAMPTIAALKGSLG
ncbi:MAG: hypothetical protein ABI634_08210 [Acidobacteriota bacterium]